MPYAKTLSAFCLVCLFGAGCISAKQPAAQQPPTATLQPPIAAVTTTAHATTTSAAVPADDEIFEFFPVDGAWKSYANSNFGLTLQYPEEWNLDDSGSGNSVIIDNMKPNDLPGRGGMPDGAIKIDIHYLADMDLNQAINCGEKIEGSIVCKNVVINGTTYRKRVVNAEIEGDHQEIILAVKTKGGVVMAVGFVPTGSKQAAGIKTVEKIFGNFKVR